LAWGWVCEWCSYVDEFVDAEPLQLVVVLGQGVVVERDRDLEFGRVAAGDFAEGAEPDDPLTRVGGASEV
jgi:hypothetical protein